MIISPSFDGKSFSNVLLYSIISLLAMPKKMCREKRVEDMANQEHLDLLKQGVDVWNKWREEHPEIKPDLTDTEYLGPSNDIKYPSITFDHEEMLSGPFL